MRLIADTVPTTFTRLDESVVAADRFVDVRTQQQMRTNHNALCGGGHMRPIFCDQFGGSYAGSFFTYQPTPPEGWAGPDDEQSLTTMYAQSIMVSPFVKKLKVRVYVSHLGIDMEFYAGVYVRGKESRELQQFTVTTTGWYTVDITMPFMARGNTPMQHVMFKLMWTPKEIGNNRLTTGAVQLLAVGDYSVTVDTATLSAAGAINYGDVLFFTNVGGTATATEPRVAQGTLVSGSNSIIYAPDTMPWTDNPPTTSDYLQAKTCTEARIQSVQLYEYALSGTFSDMVQEL